HYLQNIQSSVLLRGPFRELNSSMSVPLMNAIRQTGNGQAGYCSLSEARIGNSFDTYTSPDLLQNQLLIKSQMLQACAFLTPTTNPKPRLQPPTQNTREARIGNSFDTYTSPDLLENQLLIKSQMLQTCAFLTPTTNPEPTLQPRTQNPREPRIGNSFDTYTSPDLLENQLLISPKCCRLALSRPQLQTQK